MAVGELPLPEFYPIQGVRLGITSAGIKRVGRQDLVLIEAAAGSQIAATFTQNAFCAAPVQIAKKHWQTSTQGPQYLVINTGNANAGTGSQGLEDALATCQGVAELAQTSVENVLPFSTGVIGEPLPVDKILSALPQAYANLETHQWAQAAQGIMTTDTRPKGASLRVEIDGQSVHLSGISKGAGMIQPNMATMLAFIATDAKIDAQTLQKLHARAVQKSFNRITVDSDTSTNDACILIASGQGAHLQSESALQAFQQALESLQLTLAQAIIRDGEGATKFIEVCVEQATTEQEALEVGFTVANSPLVKTALYACDANWGRILAAVGRAGVLDLDVNQIHIWLNEVCIVEAGARAASYTEAAGSQVMQQAEIKIRIRLARGTAQASVWTSDLSHEYVSINADYRS